jgi:RNA polymerase sigma factor (sigma-70 family)
VQTMKRTAKSDLIERAWPAVVSVVRRTLGAGDVDADDVCQTVLERLLVARAEDVPSDRIAAWAGGVARNVAIDRLRARIRERRTLVRGEDESAAGAAYGIDPERLTLARERLLRYASAVASLGGGQAEVVYMHDVLGHDLGKIAAVLEITTAAAQSRLVRGRRLIADRLKAE